MGPMLVVLGDPRIKVGLQFVDGAVDLFAGTPPGGRLTPGRLSRFARHWTRSVPRSADPGRAAPPADLGHRRAAVAGRRCRSAGRYDPGLAAAGYGFHGNLGWDQGRSGRAHDARAGPAFAHANRGTLPLGVDLAPYRDPAVILIDQLKQIYMDGVLDPVDTTNWYPKLMRKDYTVGLNITETAVDDPDPAFYENYVCGAMRNYTGYCNPEVDKMVDEQSAMSDVAKRQQLVWAIEKKLADDDARPILFYPRAANCYYPKVKGLITQANSIYNGQRFEDLWLDN